MTRTKDEVYNNFRDLTICQRFCERDSTKKYYYAPENFLNSISERNIELLESLSQRSQSENIYLFLRNIKKHGPDGITPFTAYLSLLILFYIDSYYGSSNKSKIINCQNFWCFCAKTSRAQILINLSDDDDDIVFVRELLPSVYDIKVDKLRNIKSISCLKLNPSDFFRGEENVFNGYPCYNILNFAYQFSKVLTCKELDDFETSYGPMLADLYKAYRCCYRYDSFGNVFGSGNHRIRYINQDGSNQDEEFIKVPEIINVSYRDESNVVNELTNEL